MWLAHVSVLLRFSVTHLSHVLHNWGTGYQRAFKNNSNPTTKLRHGQTWAVGLYIQHQ